MIIHCLSLGKLGLHVTTGKIKSLPGDTQTKDGLLTSMELKFSFCSNTIQQAV